MAMTVVCPGCGLVLPYLGLDPDSRAKAASGTHGQESRSALVPWSARFFSALCGVEAGPDNESAAEVDALQSLALGRGRSDLEQA